MSFIFLGLLGGIGFGELVVIFVIILLLFGAKRLPEIAKSLGEGIKEFKKSLKDDTGETIEKKDDTQNKQQ